MLNIYIKRPEESNAHCLATQKFEFRTELKNTENRLRIVRSVFDQITSKPSGHNMLELATSFASEWVMILSPVTSKPAYLWNEPNRCF